MGVLLNCTMGYDPETKGHPSIRPNVVPSEGRRCMPSHDMIRGQPSRGGDWLPSLFLDFRIIRAMLTSQLPRPIYKESLITGSSSLKLSIPAQYEIFPQQEVAWLARELNRSRGAVRLEYREAFKSWPRTGPACGSIMDQLFLTVEFLHELNVQSVTVGIRSVAHDYTIAVKGPVTYCLLKVRVSGCPMANRV
ncbi:uncharacterized protein BO96DRAFT_436694 [Aspergillus niger CBS 101883]|uniref:Contig An14c0060, genomic contig n=2 Tax=Aspergillus niger TaxID=5061 RepID=A2R2N7_ASPNC|nr:uncharacterized protein BO96DRAFT_436694 [Aspergillus niger CBS 101883]XP_059602266.1 uncharacterized protein An14g01400 [Aspergillus niger]PYH53782.1 hypothetical protein BO96DRAFT_436694 [Aspergillus niger CBS 101883]CAK41920.1 unnamed protein product [Aspergillus niger]